MDDAAAIARIVTVEGRVQGVFFRAHTRDSASKHGVVGWVCNMPDGSVRAWIQGRPEDVDAVMEDIRRGPPASLVSRVMETEVEPSADYVSFEIVGRDPRG